ncbi:MAG: hypothetical protein WC389_14260, partial [Lutibacter sp.]
MKNVALLLVWSCFCVNVLAADSNKPDIKDVNAITSIPFSGEEVSLTEVVAYPKNYINKTFVVIGLVRIGDGYYSKYENAKGTHISLFFAEVRPDTSLTRERIHLYVKREIAKNLTDGIIKAIKAGHNSKLIKAKISILSERYDSRYGIVAELIDWQFLSADKSTWQNWSANNEQKIGVQIVPPFDANNGIMYNGKQRKKLWFY